MNIKKDDIVEIVTGDDAGTPSARTTGRVLSVLPKEGKIVVEGINRVYKHMKPNRRNPQGGRLSKEMAIDVSNAMLVCPNCRRGVRVLPDGSKELFAKKSGARLRLLTKPTPKYAKK